MPVIPFASSFLAGSLLSIILPIGLLVALGIWYHAAVKRVPTGRLERERPAAERDAPDAGGSPPPPAEPIP
jgi:hypothetical protein